MHEPTYTLILTNGMHTVREDVALKIRDRERQTAYRNRHRLIRLSNLIATHATCDAPRHCARRVRSNRKCAALLEKPLATIDVRL